MERYIDSYFATVFHDWFVPRGYRVEREAMGEVVTWHIYQGEAAIGYITLPASGRLHGGVANAGPAPNIPPEEDLCYYDPAVRPRAELMVRLAAGLGAYLDAALPEDGGEAQESGEESTAPAPPPAKRPRVPKRQLKTVADRRGEVANLVGQGLTAVQIAERLGCGESTVRKDCKALGLKLR